MDNNLSGKELAQELRTKIRGFIAESCRNNRKPFLVVMIAGNDPVSLYYARLIESAGAKEGIKVKIDHHPEPDNSEIIDAVKRFNADDEVDAVLVQLPLPKGIDKKGLFNILNPDKDVDGQTPLNIGRLISKQKGIFPATAKSVLSILKSNGVELAGKKAVIIGRSTTIGIPAAMMLMQENATVTVCHSKSKPLENFTKNADILVVSAGVPQIVTSHHVKEGAVVVDVGTNEIDGNMVGDVNYDELKKIARVSPVIGGVGSLTLAYLFENTYELYRKHIYCN